MERLDKKVFWTLIVYCLIGIIGSLFIKPSNAEQIEPEAELTTATVIVHWFDTEEELQTELGWDDTAGYSECEFRPDFNTSFCELWLVRPVSTEDYYNFDTIGHEFYHALAGDFHPDEGE